MTLADDTILAEMLCARLCHDMAGAIGAAAAGAELLEDGFDAETARMVAESAAAAVSRLKFFRAALGPAGSPQPAGRFRDLAAAYLMAAAPGGRMTLSLHWESARPELDGESGRLVLNLVLLARDALPRGGAVTVVIAPSIAAGAIGCAVSFTGEGAGLSAESARCLLDGARPEGPRAAQAWLTRRLVEKQGAMPRFSAISGGGRIDV
jgi:histidine phosphotransferase ChpT